jgi:integrase
MAGKQAKTLTRQQVLAALRYVRYSRYPERDRVMILLSVKAGLRASEIAKLTWQMLLTADGRIAACIELHDSAAKSAAAAPSRSTPSCVKAYCGCAVEPAPTAL